MIDTLLIVKEKKQIAVTHPTVSRFRAGRSTLSGILGYQPLFCSCSTPSFSILPPELFFILGSFYNCAIHVNIEPTRRNNAPLREAFLLYKLGEIPNHGPCAPAVFPVSHHLASKTRHRFSHPRSPTMRVASLLSAALVLISPALAAPVAQGGKSSTPLLYVYFSGALPGQMDD